MKKPKLPQWSGSVNPPKCECGKILSPTEYAHGNKCFKCTQNDNRNLLLRQVQKDDENG